MQNDQQIIVFCENMKTLRKRNNLSKKEMAKILGIVVRNLAKIEERVMPSKTSTSVIFKISHHFKIKLHELFLPL